MIRAGDGGWNTSRRYWHKVYSMQPEYRRPGQFVIDIPMCVMLLLGLRLWPCFALYA